MSRTGRNPSLFPFLSGRPTRDNMKICTLASGSSGNSLYLESEQSKILIDAGASFRRISTRLASLDVDILEIDAVILSHEHTDHSKAVEKMEVPVYASWRIADLWKDRVKTLVEFDSSTPFRLKDLLVTPFSVAHDACDPVGFTVEDGASKVGVVTDIGKITRLVVESLRGCSALVVESNHDREMLLDGPYPWHLKQRISGGDGHLSNEQSASLIEEVLHDGLRHVVLAHLSSMNNTPELAMASAREILLSNGGGRVSVSVAPRNGVSEVIAL